MLLSASGLGVIGLLAKMGMKEFSVLALLFWRFFIAFIVCIAWFSIKHPLKEMFNFKNSGLQLLRVFFLLLGQYGFFYYLEYSDLLSATVLLNTGPLFIPLIERCILKAKVGKSTWIAVVVSFIGMLCIFQPDGGIFSWISFIGLIAGMSQGASQVVFGIRVKKENPEASIVHLFFFCSIVTLIPYLSVPNIWITQEELTILNTCLLGGLAIATLWNQVSRSAAYTYGSPARLSPFLYFSVVLAGVFEWTIFHQIPNALSIIGAALVFIGGAIKIFMRKDFLQKK